MKMFIFQNSGFLLTNRQLKSLKNICVFALKFHVKSWFSSRLGISAPKNDLHLVPELLSFGVQGSLAALKKLKRQFWYLSEEAIGFLFFDNSINKRKMVQALVKPALVKQMNLSDQDIKAMKISDLITKKAMKFFDILGISTNFLEKDHNLWPNLPSFVAARKTVAKLRVTNDTAERGVTLMHQYNGLQTKSGKPTQFILQVVAEHQKKLPHITKAALAEAQTKAK